MRRRKNFHEIEIACIILILVWNTEDYSFPYGLSNKKRIHECTFFDIKIKINYNSRKVLSYKREYMRVCFVDSKIINALLRSCKFAEL